MPIEEGTLSPAAAVLVCAFVAGGVLWVPAAMLVVTLYPRHPSQGWPLGVASYLFLVVLSSLSGYLAARRRWL
jgi:hypothetical protein